MTKRLTTLLMSVALALPPMVGAPVTTTAATPHLQYHKFCKDGVADNHDLSRRLHDARKADPTGHAKPDRCQANVLQFVAAFQEAAPEEHVTIENVAEFVENGTKMVQLTEDITFYSSCVKGHSPEADDVVMRCGQPQTLKKGTWVIASIKTGKKLVKLDCGNVGFTLTFRPPCDLVVFESRDAGIKRSHHPIYGPVVRDAVCHGIVKVERDSNGNYNVIDTPRDITPGCIDRTPSCSYEGADRMAAPRRRSFDGTFNGLAPGLWAELVPQAFSGNPDNAFGVCEEFTDPLTGERRTSVTAIARNIDYFETANGQKVAHIFYTKQEMEAAGYKQDDPGGLYSWIGR